LTSPIRRVEPDSRDVLPPTIGEPGVEPTKTALLELARVDLECPSPLLLDGPGYNYFCGSSSPERVQRKAQALELSHGILNPRLTNPNFLVLRERRRILAQWLEDLPKTGLTVLDVGGRLQPYRPLLANRLGSYTAVDPCFEGLLNVVAVGEALPFQSEVFDLVVCTQVLNYSPEPFRMIAEIHRVLRPGAALFLSVPAIFPRYADQRWRFMPEGLEVLLSAFSSLKIEPEGWSIAGLFRLLNLFVDTACLDRFKGSWRVSGLVSSVVFPMMNLAGQALDVLSRGNTQFTTNYSCLALK
jgi:SAM-dependent methyltransferase